MQNTFTVRLTGLDKAKEQLKKLAEGSKAVQNTKVYAGVELSQVPYARAIETGRWNNGRIARRAGPAYYLKGAFEQTAPEAAAEISKVLYDGANAVTERMSALGDRLVARAKAIVPVKTGKLQRGIKKYVERTYTGSDAVEQWFRTGTTQTLEIT